MTDPKQIFAIGLLLSLGVLPLQADLIDNGSFEEGQTSPFGWELRGGAGAWEKDAPSGRRIISVTGNGSDSSYWCCPATKLKSGRIYRMTFRARGSGSGGCIVSGPNLINRDFKPSEQWQEFSYIFSPTQSPVGMIIRLGQWHHRGTFRFDDIRIHEVMPVHNLISGLTLGAGEQIQDNTYTFDPDFGYEGSNYTRCIHEATAGFNSNRWSFGPGQYITFKHDLGGYQHRQATVGINLGYYQAGVCLVEGSRDGQTWHRLGTLSGLGNKEFSLPERLLPSLIIYIRLRCPDVADSPERKPASFQIHNYRFCSQTFQTLEACTGHTRFLKINLQRPPHKVTIESLGDMLPGRSNHLHYTYTNPDKQTVELAGTIKIRSGESPWQTIRTFRTSPQRLDPKTSSLSHRLPYRLENSGDFEWNLSLRADGEDIFEASTTLTVPDLYNASYGYWGGRNAGLEWWWCEGTYKVSRERPAPRIATQKPVEISAARGEYEPVQIVLTPKQDLKNLFVEILDDSGFWKNAIKCYYVWYHYVHRATDSAGCIGWWPDALPSLDRPLNLKHKQNQTLWILVKVPPQIPAGDHPFALQVRAADLPALNIPIRVHVYDFDLPAQNHLESAFGLSPGLIKRYHNLETRQEERRVWDYYMQSFREHRLAPYDFAPFDPIRVTFKGPPESMRAELDLAAWDTQARRYLDKFGFTGFRLNLRGMGGGTFHSRRAGKIGPFEQGTPDYRRVFKDYCSQLQNHLQTRGWLDKAYIYWFDEPAPKDYSFVRAGMEEIKRAAPKLRRMLTEEPLEPLFGTTDIWCPILHNFDAESCQARQRQGERIWWYVCTGPKTPYPGLFIDHHAVDLRIWLWMTWKWRVQGILVWQSNYWTSPAAFPPPKGQNPWRDPMGYVSGYGRPPGYIGYWGNGDGRFIYPPNQDIETDRQKYLEGPVSSLRWEMLREGLEDYEYFYLLRELVSRAVSRGVPNDKITSAQKLLEIPEAIIKDKTHFTRDPQPLYHYRRALAEAIESLQTKSP